jgi:hypothetical protein
MDPGKNRVKTPLGSVVETTRPMAAFCFITFLKRSLRSFSPSSSRFHQPQLSLTIQQQDICRTLLGFWPE